jgi:IclR family KDG regulon transcriptional repressor
LSQLSDEAIQKILADNELRQFTPFSTRDKEQYFEKIKNVQQEGIALEREEYIEGIRALAVPLHINKESMQIAIWAVGLKSQIKDEVIPTYSDILKNIAKKIENEFAL